MSDSLGIDDDVMGLAMLTVGNDIIDNIIKILGEIEIPQGATAEQIAHVQKIIDTFFGRQESWVWIDKYSRFTSTTPKQTIFAVVMVDGGKK